MVKRRKIITHASGKKTVVETSTTCSPKTRSSQKPKIQQQMLQTCLKHLLLPQRKNLKRIRKFAILADDLTKSVGHTLSNGMQECLTYIIAEDIDGTYKPLTFRCCHYHNQDMLTLC